MKIDWTQKLSSRKFWALLASFISSLLLAFNFTESEILQVTSVITAFGSVAIYILSEAIIDKERVKSENKE